MKWLVGALLLPVLLVAQQPFGLNATWHFEYSAFGYTGYKKVAYSRDSVYKGQVWQIFEVTGLSHIKTGPGPNDIIQNPNVLFLDVMLSSRNDSLFYLDTQDTVHLLFDYNAQPGDDWTFAYPYAALGCYASPTATITNIGFDTINGKVLKYWEIENPMDTFIIQNQPFYMCASGYCLPTKFYQDVGSIWWSELFLPSPNICNGGSLNLAYHHIRCFSNDSISVNFTTKACDYWSLISINEDELTAIKIYPNPSSGLIFIDSKMPIQLVEVFDLTGRKISAKAASSSIGLPAANGLYIIQVTLKNGEVITDRVLRN